MEDGLHLRLQVQLDDRLCDSVGDRGHTEGSDPSPVLLRYLHRLYRGRHIGPRGHPVPDHVEVPFQVPLELRNGLLIDSWDALVGPHLLPGFPDHPLIDAKRLHLRLWLGHRLLPQTSWLTVNFAWMARPLRSSPVTGPSSLLPGGPPLCLAWGCGSLRFLPLGAFLGRAGRRSSTMSRSPARRQVPMFRIRA